MSPQASVWLASALVTFVLLPGCGGATGSNPSDKTGGAGGTSVGGSAGGRTPAEGGSAGETAVAGAAGAPLGGSTGPGGGAAGASTQAGEGPTPACAAGGDLDSCNPGPDQICEAGVCMAGVVWGDQPLGMELGPLGRGSGVLCQALPNRPVHQFACMDGEWCLAELLCRCGNHPGCQVGEQCVPACDGANCDDPNDYVCARDTACNADNLKKCAAQPGQLCLSGAEQCTAAEACATNEGDSGRIACGEGAGATCCPGGHWCFNQEQCRCGTGPACDETETCALNDIGFYECLPP